MHLIREGQFTVANTFLAEAGDIEIPRELQDEFTEMYNILAEMRVNRNLDPAIMWTRQKASQLEQRGSNLEFDLCKLQFVYLFLGPGGPPTAMQYARREFARFQDKHLKEIEKLMCAFLYFPKLAPSPYGKPFLDPEKSWEDVAHSFTKEFCSLLGLSAESPLYIAATAGAIALPTLLKMTSIMKEKRTEWTTQHELPVGTIFDGVAGVDADRDSGRDSITSRLPLPFHLCLPGVKRPDNGGKSTLYATVWSCYCVGVSSETGERW